MEIKSTSIQLVDIDSLVPNPKNNNKHPQEQIERLAKLIKRQGFRNPLIVSNRSGFLLCGHGRIKAAKLAGLTKVPVMFQDFDNEAQEYAYLTSDNAIASWAHLDLEAIKNEILGFDLDFDVDDLGIKDFQLDLNEFDLDEDQEEEKDTSEEYVLEARFPNKIEMTNTYNDLLSRGYMAKIKGLK